MRRCIWVRTLSPVRYSHTETAARLNQSRGGEQWLTSSPTGDEKARRTKQLLSAYSKHTILSPRDICPSLNIRRLGRPGPRSWLRPSPAQASPALGPRVCWGWSGSGPYLSGPRPFFKPPKASSNLNTGPARTGGGKPISWGKTRLSLVPDK